VSVISDSSIFGPFFHHVSRMHKLRPYNFIFLPLLVSVISDLISDSSTFGPSFYVSCMQIRLTWWNEDQKWKNMKLQGPNLNVTWTKRGVYPIFMYQWTCSLYVTVVYVHDICHQFLSCCCLFLLFYLFLTFNF